MKAGRAIPTSAVSGIVWPALPHAAAQTMLAAQFQLERSQWWTREQLLAHQLTQLRSLVRHCLQQVPHYSALANAHFPQLTHDPATLTWEDFARWPILKKGDLRELGDALLAPNLPREHGGMSWMFTTGSTGTPTRVAVSMVASFFRAALTLRHQLWHDLDFSLTYGEIRPGAPSGRAPSWGPAPSVAFETGPCVSLPISASIAEQLDWLIEEEPGYLQTTASNLRTLLLHSRATGRIPRNMDAVLPYAENLPPDLRTLAREVWGARLIDVYSCTEAGVVALQCPLHEHYHAQETVIVEVLREDGSPCAPGEIGQVVLTDLVNFGMPLIRYAIGDYAEAGAPCECGRGLPVLKRIVGRHRNMATDPTGRIFWPTLDTEALRLIAPFAQIQTVQRTSGTLDFRYLLERELSMLEQAQIAAVLAREMNYAYEVRFIRLAESERQPGQKFEEFVSLCLPEMTVPQTS